MFVNEEQKTEESNGIKNGENNFQDYLDKSAKIWSVNKTYSYKRRLVMCYVWQ